MKKSIKKICVWTGIIGVILAAAGTALWFHTFRHYAPRELADDVKAGLAARHIKEPNARVKKFLETRYGPLTDPANRQRAFLDFFNVDHIKGLRLIVDHSPPNEKKANTEAMAEWIASYRDSMSQEEKAALQARLATDEGRAMLRRATLEYLTQDAYFQGNQNPVVGELMVTLSTLQK